MTSPVVPSQGGATALGRSAARRWSRPGPPGRPSAGAAGKRRSRREPGSRRVSPGRRRCVGSWPARARFGPAGCPRTSDPRDGGGRPSPKPRRLCDGSGLPPLATGPAALRRLCYWLEHRRRVEPTLPSRGLRQGCCGDADRWQPGARRVTQNMAGTAVPVRRMPEVKAAGAMRVQRQKTGCPKPAPAQHISTGSGSVPSSGRGAAGPPGVVTGDGEIRRSVAVPRAGISNTAPAAPGRPGPVNRERAAGSARGQHDRIGSSIPGPAGGRGWVARRRDRAGDRCQQRSAAPPAVQHAAQPTDPRSAESLSSALRRSWARPASVADQRGGAGEPRSGAPRSPDPWAGPRPAEAGDDRVRWPNLARRQQVRDSPGRAKLKRRRSTTRARTPEIGPPATPARTSPVAMSPTGSTAATAVALPRTIRNGPDCHGECPICRFIRARSGVALPVLASLAPNPARVLRLHHRLTPRPLVPVRNPLVPVLNRLVLTGNP